MSCRLISPILISLTLLYLTSCASLGSKANRLTLENAITIKPGVSTKADIENAFGKPHRILQLGEYPEQHDNGEIWAYYEEPFTNSSRLSLYFKKGADITSSVGWDVREEEMVQNLEAAKNFLVNHFPSAHFQERAEGWTQSHSYSDNKYIEDPKLGVAISFRSKRKEVSGMSWSDPKLYSEMVQKHQRRLACAEGNCSSLK